MKSELKMIAESKLQIKKEAASLSTTAARGCDAVTSIASGDGEAIECSSIGGETTCIVCFIGKRTHLADPCGHLGLCGECAAMLQECPCT
eukprot:7082878-Prymnesium_polylepis.1